MAEKLKKVDVVLYVNAYIMTLPPARREINARCENAAD